MKLPLTILFALLTTACSTIKSHESYTKAMDIEHTVSIGTEIFRIKKTRDLPNAFGNKDIWGGKVNTGYSELRFMGLEDDGLIRFRFTDIDIESNESVFTRYGHATTTVNTKGSARASVYGNQGYATSNSQATINHYDKRKATITQLPANTVEFTFDPKDVFLKLGKTSVEIKGVSQHNIRYILHN
jgi:hypothetical protein